MRFCSQRNFGLLHFHIDHCMQSFYFHFHCNFSHCCMSQRTATKRRPSRKMRTMTRTVTMVALLPSLIPKNRNVVFVVAMSLEKIIRKSRNLFLFLVISFERRQLFQFFRFFSSKISFFLAKKLSSTPPMKYCVRLCNV